MALSLKLWKISTGNRFKRPPVLSENSGWFCRPFDSISPVHIILITLVPYSTRGANCYIALLQPIQIRHQSLHAKIIVLWMSLNPSLIIILINSDNLSLIINRNGYTKTTLRILLTCVKSDCAIFPNKFMALISSPYLFQNGISCDVTDILFVSVLSFHEIQVILTDCISICAVKN